MGFEIMEEYRSGSKVLAYGYEAVARGALEAGVKLVVGYPGTPSTGALEALAAVADSNEIHVEWATSERVAMEMAWGSAMNGQRSMCTVNHLGANVIVDVMKYAVNYGVRGGLVLFVGDDIGANTSALEADSRILADSADMPVLSPSTADEAREMTKYAFELSEELGCPVMVRSVCQLMMGRTLVTVGAIEKSNNEPRFAPSPKRVVMYEKGFIPAVLIHRSMHDNLDKANEILAFYNKEDMREGAKLGIISCGVSYTLVQDALDKIDARDRVSLLKLGVVNPINENKIGSFMEVVEKVLVIEEGEAFVEQRVLSIIGKRNLNKKVLGRTSKLIPYGGELFVKDIIFAIEIALSNDVEIIKQVEKKSGAVGYLEERNLTPCSGCSHLGVFYALREAMSAVNDGNYVAVSDAGCSFMGILNPANTLNSATNMGGAISFASGVAQSGSKVPVLALVGDGGFMHGSINGLINAVYNQAQIVVIVLDNSTLGNTGLQPTACTGKDATGKQAPRVNIEGLCRQLGVQHVKRVDPYHLVQTTEAIKEAVNGPKPAVIIAEQPCALNRMKDEKARSAALRRAVVVSEACTMCGICKKLNCPAIVQDNYAEVGAKGTFMTRLDICTGCGMCQELCKYNAITMVEVSK